MPRHRRHDLSIALAAIACGIALTACGSSAKSNSPHTSAGPNRPIRYADCMRSHGVPGFPDPGTNGVYILPPEIDVSSPTFRSAQHACEQYGHGTGRDLAFTTARLLTLVKLARCMRAQHITDFPDPASTPLASLQRVRASGIDPQSPAFKHAATACRAPGLPAEIQALTSRSATTPAVASG
jgi:hypothetical protein